MDLFGNKKMQPPETPPAAAGPSYDILDQINWEVNANRKLRDCQWFALFKGQKLKKLGYDSQNVYVRTPRADPKKPGPNHVVRRAGDWILDNQDKHPYPYAEMARRYQEVNGFTDADVYLHAQGKWVPK
jgi:predicted transglutaminase-like cysteine proteinase